MGIVAAHETFRRGPFGRPTGGGGAVSWVTPRGVPGFGRRIVVRPGSHQFEGLMGLAIAAGRRGLGLVDPCGNTGEVIGPNGQCTLPQYLPANYVPSNPNAPAVPGAVAVNAYRSNPAYVGGCPVIDPTSNLCAYGSGVDTIACSELRECDGVLGSSVHYAYALPGGPDPNVDISVAGRGYQGNPNNANYLGPAAAIAAASASAGNAPTGGGGATGPGGSPSGKLTATPVSLQLTNVSRPGMPLRVLDQWSLTIIGTPNSPVTIDATQDGKRIGTGTPFGSTDSSGKRIISGVMTADTVGVWSETVHVAGLSADLAFTVAAPASGAAPPPATDTGGGGKTPTDNNAGTDPGVSSAGASSCLRLISSTETCVGPVGMFTGLAFIAAAWFLFGGKRR